MAYVVCCDFKDISCQKDWFLIEIWLKFEESCKIYKGKLREIKKDIWKKWKGKFKEIPEKNENSEITACIFFKNLGKQVKIFTKPMNLQEMLTVGWI